MVRLLGTIALDFFNCSVQVAKKWKGELSPKCFEDLAAEFVDESHHLAGFRFAAFAVKLMNGSTRSGQLKRSSTNER